MDVLHQLEYNFEIMLHKARVELENYPQENRFVPLKWMQKLKNDTSNVREARIRNDFMNFLLVALQSQSMSAPFDKDPPEGPLSTLSHLVPEATTMRSDQPLNADIFRKSPDGGQFLLRQPVPKSGVFCYMAIVNKPQK